MIQKDEQGLYFLLDDKKIYKFSEHFTVSEMFATNHKEFTDINYKNADSSIILNLLRLCNALEVIRHFLGDTAIHINSGYRCYGLNLKVGGVYSSNHRHGLAADLNIEPTEHLLKFLRYLKSIGFLNEVIPYYDRHFVHVSVPINKSPNNLGE